MQKRGQEMTLGTIILIVLGVAVLVFLIFGFSTGWNNLWDKVTSFTGSSNVDTIKQACALACSSQSENAYCDEVRTVKYSDKTWEKGSCNALSGGRAKIELDSCPISCNSVPDVERSEKTCGDLNGEWKNEKCSGVSELKVTDPSDKRDNEYCCELSKTCQDLGGTWSTGVCPVGSSNWKGKVTNFVNQGNAQYCCVANP